MFCSIWIIHNQYPCKTVFPLNNRIRLFWKHPVKISGGLVLFLRRLGCLLSLSIRHGQHFRMNTINGVLISLPFMHRCLNTTGGLFRRHFWSSGLHPDFGSPDSITEKHITGRSFWHHRPARWEEDLRITVVNGFCFCSRICTAISFTSLLSFALFSATMSFSRSLLKMA